MTDDPEDDRRLSQAIAADLIHELRHPLMALKLGLQFVEGDLGEKLSASADWPVVLGQVARLEQLLQTYQHLASPEGVPVDWFELEPVVNEVVASCQPAVGALKDRFVFQPPPPGLKAWGAVLTFRHALRNVLLNALDALEGKPAGQVELRLSVGPTGRAEVRVSDSGSGISPEVAARVFESGFTTKPLGKGSGLGLAIARRLMKAVGGEVRINPEGDPTRAPWASTELCLSFAAPATSLPVARATASAPRVLLVDDDGVIRSMLERGLGKSGMVVVSAETVDQAVSLFGKSTFDAVVTDKNLRGTATGGLEVARLIREANPFVALVMMTGYASLESARAMKELGADAYLTKPFEIESLVLAVSRAIERRRNERTRREAGPRQFGAPRRVLVVEADDKDRGRLVSVLGDLKCVPLKRDSLGRALEELGSADALVVESTNLTQIAKARLRDLRAARPDFRVVLIAPADNLMHTMDRILLDAHELLRPWSNAQADATLRLAFGLESGPS